MADNNKGQEKSCFVIGQIGHDDSPERNHADYFLEYIAKSVLQEAPFNYTVTRADEIAPPGMINAQVINSLFEADLVVADLTNHNPNAFYELAIRHMEEKPVIQMILKEQQIPFDVQDYRAISFSLDNPKLIEEAKRVLAAQTTAVEEDNFIVSNPITMTRSFIKLQKSEDSSTQLLAGMANELSHLRRELEEVKSRQRSFDDGWRWGPTGEISSNTSSLATSTVDSPLARALAGQNPGVSSGLGIGGYTDPDPLSGGITGLNRGFFNRDIPTDSKDGNNDEDKDDE
jgi:hypothetical protein